MKKENSARITHAFAACVVSAVASVVNTARADTLLWYRFDGDSATIVNKANPGTMDGTLKSINTWGSLGGLGDNSAKFPTRGDAFPEGTRIIDPALNAVQQGTVKSLSFTGDAANSGTVLLSKADASSIIALKRFTCEAFFKIPSAALNRSADALFPIVEFGSDKDTTENQGWKLGFFLQNGKLQPWVRGCLANSSNGKGSTYWTLRSAGQVISENNGTLDDWHHIALVVDGDGDGGSATVSLVVDYKVAATQTIDEYYGFYFPSLSAFPLTIGADLYRSTKACSFMGEIAEFRISNTALAADKLLRPLPAGPVDADTLVYLPMGDSGWFGSPNTAGYTNIYHGILNAAPTAAWTPHWYFNTSSSVPYPVVEEGSVVESLRGGYFAATAYGDASSMRVSRALVSGKYQGHVVLIPYENAGLADDSFTIEWFFRTDGQIPSGDSINSCTFLYNSFAKIMINQSNGLLLTRLTPASGSTKDFNSSARVDDGKWHHYAFVYDKKQGAFSAFLDYRKIASETFTLTTSTQTPFSFGGFGRQEQGFAGNLDDFRITKRALSAGEFLTTRAAASSGAAILSHFDNSLSAGVDAAYAPDGVGGTLGGGSAPTYVNAIRRIDLDGDSHAEFVSTRALRLDGGSVVYPHNPLLECRDFTVEWFAKYESIADVSMLLRLGMESDNGTGTMCWALFNTGGALRLAAQTTADGSWHNLLREDKNFVDRDVGAVVADGKWHHWALVAETHEDLTPANTTFRLYKDYEQVGNALVFDKNGAGGILALPSTGTTLSIGTGSKSIVGCMDELLFRPGVKPVSSFMRRVHGGLMVIVK
ncbi:MAG: LamG domain-containing protein [Kiritimatiellae bacterium]|nr:LamG domain-containing protein [Kiritimatiellia bacterium]